MYVVSLPVVIIHVINFVYLYVLILDILERPITTYTVKSDGINTLCEVKEDDFQQILLSSIHDKANDLRSKTNKPQQYRSS